MKRMVYLSYPLDRMNPVYGSFNKEMEIVQIKSLNRGDSCNSCRITLENHWGTHVDCPAHFFLDGNDVLGYPADYWFFANPQIIQLTVEPGEIITEAYLGGAVHAKTDLLLIHTGWGKYRGEEKYSICNPGLSPELGFYFRSKFPLLRAIGFDFVSVSSYQDRESGRQAHRALLDPHGEGRPILVVEDMCLPDKLEELKTVWIAPLRVAGIDGAPCMVMGVLG